LTQRRAAAPQALFSFSICTSLGFYYRQQVQCCLEAHHGYLFLIIGDLIEIEFLFPIALAGVKEDQVTFFQV